MSDWDWQDVSNGWHGFNPAKHKRGLLAVLLMFLSMIIYTWAAQPTNGVFHSTTTQHYCTSTVFTDCVADPANLIGDFAGNSMNGYNSQNTVSSGGFLTLQPNATFPAIAVSKAQVDLSSANGREVVFDTDMSFGATVNTATFDAYVYYLTTNSSISTSTSYSPLSDPSVIFAVGMGNCGVNGCEYDIFMSNNQTGTLAGQNFGGCLPNSSVVNGCPTVAMHSNAGADMDAVFLNYTGVNGSTNGGQNGVSCAALGNTLGGANRCSSLDFNGNNFSTFIGQVANTWRTYPRLALSRYYLGFFVAPKNSGTINTAFAATTNVGFGTTDAMIIYNFLPSAQVQTPPSPIQGAGFFQPLVDLFVHVGVFLVQNIFNFFSYLASILGPVLSITFNILENFVKNVLNAIGNALGFGNVGTDLVNFLNAVISFFSNQLPNYIANFPSYITNFLNLLTIEFPFLSPLFTIANAILAFGVAGVAEGIVILTIGLQMFLFGYGTLMVAAYFLYVGDDGIGGFFTYLGTLEALSFKILNIIATVTNLGIDILVHVISLIPKPLVQMGAGHLPRLPTVESGASISFPKLDFGEARNGNLIVYWLWCMGLWFIAWFESRNPSLPGSIGALDPAVATNVRQLASYIPLLQAATLISGGLVLIWFCMLPLNMAGIDVREAPFGASLGRLTGPGPSGVSIQAGKKHLIGRAARIQRELDTAKEAKAKVKGKVAETKVRIETKQAEKKKDDRLARALAKAETERHLGKK